MKLKKTCNCKPGELCYHALADVFSIPTTKPKPKKSICVVCEGVYGECRCFEGEEK